MSAFGRCASSAANPFLRQARSQARLRRSSLARAVEGDDGAGLDGHAVAELDGGGRDLDLGAGGEAQVRAEGDALTWAVAFDAGKGGVGEAQLGPGHA